MVRITDIVEQLPEMMFGDELLTALAVIPEYDDDIVNKSATERLRRLSDLYKLYIPSTFSQEIYYKCHLALVRSLEKKASRTTIEQRNENHKIIRQQEYSSVIGGADSFSVIGESGLGKSSAISRAVSLISGKKIIEVDVPYTKVIPCLVVQCPFDSSPKNFLASVLLEIDSCLGSNYYTNAMKGRATTDTLIGTVSQVALNHIGLLVVDEVQNMANSKNGKNLVGVLTQLINQSGIAICLVGTPECTVFFEQAMQLARRSLGLQHSAMEYGDEFIEFCKTALSYQYVKEKAEITEVIIRWLYEHSGGNASAVISLIHDAQEIAIISAKETLNIETLNEAYQKRLSFLHGYLKPMKTRSIQTSTIKRKREVVTVDVGIEAVAQNEYSIAELVAKAKEGDLDIVQLLRENIAVEEVPV